MPVTIPSGLTDDNDFVEQLNSMLKVLLVQHAPEQLWVIQIDNWFDHKWLGFSGNGAVASNFLPKGLGSAALDRFSSVKATFRQDQLTFPPFAPDRVVAQWSFLRSGEHYTEAPLPRLPHSTKRRPSSSNLHTRVAQFTSSGLFVWFSGNTLKNGRGSVMVYDLTSAGAVCWFAAFNRNPQWELQQTKGVDRENVLALLGSGSE